MSYRSDEELIHCPKAIAAACNDMANEFRTAGIPLSYYNIWDDLPFPHWNEPFYESCDLLMAISKQTYNINKHVCQRKPRIEGVDLTYVPHGINTDLYKPLDDTDAKVVGMKQELFKDKDIDFVAFSIVEILEEKDALI